MQGRKNSVWRDIPDYEGYYQVSDMGEVRSLDRETTPYDDNRWGIRTVKLKGRIIKPQKANKVGHLKVTLSKEGVVQQWLVHVLVWKAFEGYHDVINHLNGRAWDNRLANLRSGTHAENMKHARDYGLWNVRGELACGAKLTETKVKQMRKLREAGHKLRELSAIFGVTESQCSEVCNRNAWRHVA